jgi:RNA polymerase sigma-70 factor (ECF subfamily)
MERPRGRAVVKQPTVNHRETSVEGMVPRDGDPSDQDLIDRALAGYRESFGELVCRYQDRLFHTLHYAMGSAEDAQDAAQDAFVQAYLKLETFQRESRFFTWLYRIAVNAWISRKRKKRPSLAADPHQSGGRGEPADHADGPQDRLVRNENIRQVREAIACLAEEYRCVLLLREFEGFCYEEIAEILDLPIGTVRSRLSRARIQLKNLLAGPLGVDSPQTA